MPLNPSGGRFCTKLLLKPPAPWPVGRLPDLRRCLEHGPAPGLPLGAREPGAAHRVADVLEHVEDAALAEHAGPKGDQPEGRFEPTAAVMDEQLQACIRPQPPRIEPFEQALPTRFVFARPGFLGVVF